MGGGKPSSVETINIYKLHISILDGKLQSILATEVFSVCAPLSVPRISTESLQSFGDLPFASDFISSDETTIDVLFGLDAYWKLGNPGNVVVCGGLVVQETVFGWVLTGLETDLKREYNDALSMETSG